MGQLVLLEDERDIAESIEAILELDGHRVHSVSRGREALLLLAREHPDLLLLDVDVPDLSGLAVGRAAGDFTAVPTVILSAGAGDWQRQAFRGGAIACLAKPFDVDDLRRLVATLLDERHSRAETQVAQLPVSDLARLRELTPSQLDELPYGVIEIDRAGTIVSFNRYESMATHHAPDDVLGRPFAELAPCTQVQRFAGAIDEGLRRADLDRVLRFVFPCHDALSIVSVRLYYNDVTRTVWVFVSRRAPTVTDRVAPLDELSAPSTPVT